MPLSSAQGAIGSTAGADFRSQQLEGAATPLRGSGSVARNGPWGPITKSPSPGAGDFVDVGRKI